MAELSSVDLGEGVRCLVVDHDPTITPTNLNSGGLIVRQSTGRYYRKLDNGSTTNVVEISFGTGTYSFMLARTVTVTHNRGYRPIVQVDLDLAGRFGRGTFGREGFGESGTYRVVSVSIYNVIHLDDNRFTVEFDTTRTGHIHYN